MVLAWEPLKTRDMPRQARAVARIHLILDSTAKVLRTTAPHLISTTMIAETAEIPVSSIYRYFTNVDDVLNEIYLQTAARIRADLFAILEDAETYPGWRDRLRAVLDTQRAYLAEHPYYRPLLVYFFNNRGPVAVAEEEHDQLVFFLRDRWQRGLDGFSGGDAEVVANTVVQIAISMEDLIAAQATPAQSNAYIAALWQVLDGFLSTYLND